MISYFTLSPPLDPKVSQLNITNQYYYLTPEQLAMKTMKTGTGDRVEQAYVLKHNDTLPGIANRQVW